MPALPAAVRPQVRRCRVAGGRGPVCGRRIRGQPPAVAPDPSGATAPRVGEGVMAAAHLLP